MKLCIRCNTEKPLLQFAKRKSSADGCRAECKDCKRKRDRELRNIRLSSDEARQREAEKARLFVASRSPEEKKRVNAVQVEYARKKAQAAKEEFFTEHGCTKQECKWRQDGDKFLVDSVAKNGAKYGYFAVDYQGVWKPVILWCNVHKSYFMQAPKFHKEGQGCPQCGKIATGNALRKSQEDFLKQAEDFCEDKFTFTDVVYTDNITHIQVTCKVHGNFPISPGNLLSGKGCPSCAKYGYRNNIPGSLYVLYNGELTKVGITNGEVPIRVRQINSKGKGFQIISQYLFEDGRKASDLEMTLLRELRKKYLQPTDKFDGSTECFLGLDPHELASDILARLPKHIEETYDYHRPEFRPWTPQITGV